MHGCKKKQKREKEMKEEIKEMKANKREKGEKQNSIGYYLASKRNKREIKEEIEDKMKERLRLSNGGGQSQRTSFQKAECSK